ncbi:MAG: DUF3592 domain-containing protein [Ruminococcus sp.]|nr:DUF3592 domain-containing protein [Ruminococcus sp.]
MTICNFAAKNRPAIMGILAGVSMALYGIFGYSHQRDLVKRCKTETTGTVVSVEQVSHPTRNYGRSTQHLLYQAVIEPDDETIFDDKQLVTDKTEHIYQNGDKVTIYYSSADTEAYYIEYASPSATGHTMIACGLLLTAVGGLFFYFEHRKNNF